MKNVMLTSVISTILMSNPVFAQSTSAITDKYNDGSVKEETHIYRNGVSDVRKYRKNKDGRADGKGVEKSSVAKDAQGNLMSKQNFRKDGRFKKSIDYNADGTRNVRRYDKNGELKSSKTRGKKWKDHGNGFYSKVNRFDGSAKFRSQTTNKTTKLSRGELKAFARNAAGKKLSKRQQKKLDIGNAKFDAMTE